LPEILGALGQLSGARQPARAGTRPSQAEGRASAMT
jgi:hypothetical protein